MLGIKKINNNKKGFTPTPISIGMSSQSERGFTLVEIIVAMGLFIVVATSAIGALLTVMDSNRKVKSLRAGMDNLNVALEQMIREMRTGGIYHCDPIPPGNLTPSPPAPINNKDCPTGGDTVAFISQSGDTIAYKENSGTIVRSVNGGAFSRIIAPDITINDLEFYVSGSNPYIGQSGVADTKTQAHIIIYIDGSVDNAGVNSNFQLQTMATQRSSE